MKKDVSVIYPQFAACKKYTIDKYWKDIFEGCSMNKFPCRGIGYNASENILYVKAKGEANKKSTSYSLPEDSKVLYYLMMDIFRNKLKLTSELDLNLKKTELEEIKEKRNINFDCEWKDIKSRGMRDLLISRWVLQKKEDMNMDWKQAKSLYNIVNLGISIKKLNPLDFDYSNENLRDIRGIEFDEEASSFKITNSPEKNQKSSKTVATNILVKNMEKYYNKFQ